MSGLFITFEGGEGSGKSTQVRLLVEELRRSGHTVVQTREPGGTPTAEKIRSILLDPSGAVLTDKVEVLLFAAARAQHVAEVIRPALERGEVVICDRYVDSSVAYQGYGRGISPDVVFDTSMWATDHCLPDVTFLLDVPVAAGLTRVGLRNDTNRLDAEPTLFHESVRAAFLDLATQNPSRFRVLDATESITDVHHRIVSEVQAILTVPV